MICQLLVIFALGKASAFCSLPFVHGNCNTVPRFQRNELGQHSSIEDEALFFADDEDEIEAMGGDPFFLTGDDVEGSSFLDTGSGETPQSSSYTNFDQLSDLAFSSTGGAASILQQLGHVNSTPQKQAAKEQKPNSRRAAEVEAMGGDPFFLTNEDDDFEGNFVGGMPDQEGEELDPVAFQMLSEIAIAGGDATRILEGLDPNSVIDTDKLHSEEARSERHAEDDLGVKADEILEMGGDPFFLTDNDESFLATETSDEEHNDILSIGGDPSFLS